MLNKLAEVDRDQLEIDRHVILTQRPFLFESCGLYLLLASHASLKASEVFQQVKRSITFLVIMEILLAI